MHHRMPPSKIGWPSLNVMIFPPVMRLVLDDPKQLPTREIIDQIHELIVEDRRISAKSIAEQLDIHVNGLGPSFLKVCTCGSSPRSGSRNAWTLIINVNGASRLSKFWNFFGRRDPNDFLSGAIGNHGWNLVISLWPGDKATISRVAA